MDFNDTPDEATFRKQVREWLHGRAKLRMDDGAFDAEEMENGASIDMEKARAWMKTKAQAGYARVAWPREYGGMGGTPMQAIIFAEEEARFDVPSSKPFSIGLGMCIPTLMTYGSEAAKLRHIKTALEGREIWCQLFSEPAAGSDSAGVRTRAVRDGDNWVVNGQKVWTTGAHFSDFGLLLVRTDPDAPKHKGLTMFYLPMRAEGIAIKPIRQASGSSGFNEVFLSDVVIPDSQRLGDINGGWSVALTTLMHERLAFGGGQGRMVDIPQLLKLAKSLDLEDGPAMANAHVRDRIADWYVRSAGLKYTNYRILTALSRGQQPGPEASITKVVAASRFQEMATFALDLLGDAGVVSGSEAEMGGAFQMAWQASPGRRIAGGTDEILRNIIAERVLQLPPDVRVDKDVPFKKIPTGR